MGHAASFSSKPAISRDEAWLDAALQPADVSMRRNIKATVQNSIGGLMRIRFGQRMVEAPPDGGGDREVGLERGAGSWVRERRCARERDTGDSNVDVDWS